MRFGPAGHAYDLFPYVVVNSARGAALSGNCLLVSASWSAFSRLAIYGGPFWRMKNVRDFLGAAEHS